jgi:hypothetical protein
VSYAPPQTYQAAPSCGCTAGYGNGNGHAQQPQQPPPSQGGTTPDPAPNGGGDFPKPEPKPTVPDDTSSALFGQPSGSETSVNRPTNTPPATPPSTTTPGDANKGANGFDAPKLFNPQDRTAQHSIAPVRTAVYQQPASYHPISTVRTTLTAEQVRKDAAGWKSGSN